MYNADEIRIRDPYIVFYNHEYYMYKSGYVSECKSKENSIFVHKSKDLKLWGEERVVYTLSENSWGYMALWAPEVHLYKGKYYMFLSILGKNELRGTEISVSDTPLGPFVPLKNGPVTPADKSCIDGTLYVENGVPYIVYSADWPDNYDEEKNCYIGSIWALQLTDDLKDGVGKPFMLFSSDEAPCSLAQPIKYNGKESSRFGSDAPFLMKLSNKTLFLTWSPYPIDHYIVAGAISESGSIKGPWKHYDTPLFDRNGGHAMFFDDSEGKKKMCIHCPERPPFERALILDVKEENGIIKVVDN